MSNGFDLRQHINLRDPELLDEFRAILDRREQGSLTRRGAANIIKEDIGERQALDRLSRRFPGSVRAVVARRPNGVPILDAVLRTPNGEFVIVEAKFSSAGKARLGRTNSRMWVAVARGWQRVKLKGVTTQMSPQWINERLIELGDTGDKAARRLAAEINQALRAGRVRALTVVTDSTGEVLKIIDHTEELQRSFTRAAPFRTPSPELPAPTAGRPAAGDRAVSSRTTTAAAAEEAEALAARRASTVVARKGGEVAVRQAAIRGAAGAVGRVLVAGLVRLVAVLNVLGWVLLAVELISWISDHYREKAIQEALEKGLETNIPTEITTALERDRDEIARHYARAWLAGRHRQPVFLYLSPRIIVEGRHYEEGFKFWASAPVKSLADDLVSMSPIAPRRRELGSNGPSYYGVEIRWSVDQPIYTPFDIYLAFTEFFVEHIVDSWAMQYSTGTKLDPATVKRLHGAVDFLAYMSATLKFEPWFGFVPEDRAFSSGRAAVERWEALQGLSARLVKELIPAVSTFEAKGLINPRTMRWDAYWSPLRSELDPREDESLVPAMQTIATDMKYLDSKHLEYERFETLHARETAGHNVLFKILNASIEAQKLVDLREYLKPVQKYLPASLAPSVPMLELSGTAAGQLVIEAPESTAPNCKCQEATGAAPASVPRRGDGPATGRLPGHGPEDQSQYLKSRFSDPTHRRRLALLRKPRGRISSPVRLNGETVFRHRMHLRLVARPECLASSAFGVCRRAGCAAQAAELGLRPP